MRLSGMSPAPITTRSAAVSVPTLKSLTCTRAIGSVRAARVAWRLRSIQATWTSQTTPSHGEPIASTKSSASAKVWRKPRSTRSWPTGSTAKRTRFSAAAGKSASRSPRARAAASSQASAGSAPGTTTRLSAPSMAAASRCRREASSAARHDAGSPSGKGLVAQRQETPSPAARSARAAAATPYCSSFCTDTPTAGTPAAAYATRSRSKGQPSVVTWLIEKRSTVLRDTGRAPTPSSVAPRRGHGVGGHPAGDGGAQPARRRGSNRPPLARRHGRRVPGVARLPLGRLPPLRGHRAAPLGPRGAASPRALRTLARAGAVTLLLVLGAERTDCAALEHLVGPPRRKPPAAREQPQRRPERKPDDAAPAAAQPGHRREGLVLDPVGPGLVERRPAAHVGVDLGVGVGTHVDLGRHHRMRLVDVDAGSDRRKHLVPAAAEREQHPPRLADVGGLAEDRAVGDHDGVGSEHRRPRVARGSGAHLGERGGEHRIVRGASRDRRGLVDRGRRHGELDAERREQLAAPRRGRREDQRRGHRDAVHLDGRAALGVIRPADAEAQAAPPHADSRDAPAPGGHPDHSGTASAGFRDPLGRPAARPTGVLEGARRARRGSHASAHARRAGVGGGARPLLHPPRARDAAGARRSYPPARPRPGRRRARRRRLHRGAPHGARPPPTVHLRRRPVQQPQPLSRQHRRHLLPLTRLQTLYWRAQLFGSARVPELAALDAQFGAPLIGLRDVYRQGLALVDATARARTGKDFVDLPPATQDAIFDAVDAAAPRDPRRGLTFVDLLIMHTLEGCFGPPEYGGNRRRQGWLMIGLEGDSQPLGYSIYSLATQSYHDRPDGQHPMASPNPDEIAGPIPLTPTSQRIQDNIAMFSNAVSTC